MENLPLFNFALGLSKREMSKQLEQMLNSDSIDDSTKSALKKVNVDEVFATYDKNNDGKITSNEASAPKNFLVKTDENSMVSLQENSESAKKITKEDFLKMELSELDLDPESGLDLTDINREKLFDHLDKNKQGFITLADIKSLKPEELKEFKQVFETSAVQTPVESTNQMPTFGSMMPNNNFSGFINTPTVNPVEEPSIGDNLESVRAEKQKVIDDAASKIQEKNKELNKLVNQDVNVSDALKTDHTGITGELNTLNSNIQVKETEISGYESELQSISSNISGMESELSALKSRKGEDEEAQGKTKARISKLNSDIAEAKQKQKELEGKKQAVQDNLDGLKQQKTGIEDKLSQIEGKIFEASPQLKPAAEAIKAEIAAIKAEKTEKITKLDAKIAELNAKQKNDSIATGRMLGSSMGEYMETLFGEIADRADIVAKSKGQVDYCSRYIASCIRELFKQQGIDNVQVPQSPSGMQNWIQQFPDKIKVYNFREMSDEDKRNFELQPGMIVRMQWLGTSESNPQMHKKNHVQFVKQALGNGQYVAQDWDSGKGVGAQNANILDDKIATVIDWSGLLEYSKA